MLMKHFLLISTFLISFSVFTQEVETKSKVNHAFSLSAGMFAQGGTQDYLGTTYSFSYQAYFPNRFIFGLQFIRDVSQYKELNPGYAFPTSIKVNGISGGVHLGLHAVKRKNIDLNVFIVPHFNSQEYFKRYYNESENKYEISKSKTEYLFVPIIAYRVEAFYKFNPTHSLGLTGDVNLEFEWDGLFDLLSADIFAVGRLMLTYRITLPNR